MSGDRSCAHADRLWHSISTDDRIIRAVVVNDDGAGAGARRQTPAAGGIGAGGPRGRPRASAAPPATTSRPPASPRPGRATCCRERRRRSRGGRAARHRRRRACRRAPPPSSPKPGAAPRAGCKNVVTFSIGEHVTAGAHRRRPRSGRGAHGYAGSVGMAGAQSGRARGLPALRRPRGRSRRGRHRAAARLAHQIRRSFERRRAGRRRSRRASPRITCFNGARTGDGVCISVVRDTAKYVGMAVSNLATVLDPEAVVLGGTLAVVRRHDARRHSPRMQPPAAPGASRADPHRPVDAGRRRRRRSARRAPPRSRGHDPARGRRSRPARPRRCRRAACSSTAIASSPIEPRHHRHAGGRDAHRCRRRADRAGVRRRARARRRRHRRARRRRGDRARSRRGCRATASPRFVPTSVACDPDDARHDARRASARSQAAATGAAARVLPAHLESNFINPEYKGAQPLACLRRRATGTASTGSSDRRSRSATSRATTSSRVIARRIATQWAS